jgi:dipeptidase E
MPGHIVTMGGGGFSTEPENPLLDAYVLSLARRPRPRVCFVGTASGDSITYALSFHRACVAL